MQLLARDIGAELVKLDHAEYGPATLQVDQSRDAAVRGRAGYVARVDVARRLGRHVCRTAIARWRQRNAVTLRPWATRRSKIYGVQFHPEVVHTEYGRAVLDNFLHQIAGLWQRVEDGIVRRGAGRADPQARRRRRAICALSGGVDSAVAATLVARAIGERLTCIFVDHGLLRKARGRRRRRGVSRRVAPQRAWRSTRASVS